MVYECPTSAKTGHRYGVLSWLRWLFSAVARQKERVNSISKRKERPSSNAAYHLTVKQMQRVVNTATSIRDQVMLQMLAETGMRRSELVQLRVEDIRFDNRLLVIRHGKGNRSRVIPITVDLAHNLHRLTTGSDRGPVFVSKRGTCLSVRQVNRIVAAVGRRAGIYNPNPRQQNITCHLFRHSFARIWKNSGGSIETLSRILGHQSQKTTWDLYGTQSFQDVKRNYETIMRKLFR